MDQLEPWIQDVLDAIEYANGPVTSKWGALRAKNGHPEPFHLKYVEIGNENGMGYGWGGGKPRRLSPALQGLLRTHQGEASRHRHDREHPHRARCPTDVVDEHYYEPSEWFFKAAAQYDHYDRAKPKIYVGEYAVRKDAGNGNMLAAMAEQRSSRASSATPMS